MFILDYSLPFYSITSSWEMIFINCIKLIIFVSLLLISSIQLIKTKNLIKPGFKVRLNKHILIYIYDYSTINIHRWKSYFGHYAIKTSK